MSNLRSHSTSLRKKRDALQCKHVPLHQRISPKWIGKKEIAPIAYVVESGMYSDRSVVAVCDDLKKAQRIQKITDDSGFLDPNDVSPYAVNLLINKLPNKAVYLVRMFKNGKLVSEPDVFWTTHGQERLKYFIYEIDDHTSEKDNIPAGKESSMRVFVLALNPDHAVKIANERRTIAIAMNLWEVGKNNVPFPK